MVIAVHHEVGAIQVDVPVAWAYRRVANALRALDNLHFAVLGSFFGHSLRPGACDQEVSSLELAGKIVANGIKLHLGAALCDEYLEVVRNVEHLSYTGLGTF